MKKVFVLILGLVLIFTSCSDDDSDGSSDQFDPSLIIGTWNLEDTDIDGTTSTTIQNQPVQFTANTELMSADFTLTFDSNGDYDAQGQSSYRVTTALFPEQIIDSDIQSATGTYTINDREIIFTGDSFIGVFGDQVPNLDGLELTINTLTDTRLILDVEGTVQQQLFGTEADVDVDGFIEFSKS
ncbi:hypothetical protein BST97_14970 [Nonlabens spongiae]|uniref:Lipocalin-like domain-containing protein n=1 Tax=Nonlabens spongiae TaxID=331648 RepID=A0A1W6MNL2_9FLAO|nr:hypothetical protein [Nonlabens spongiae]ARN79181.1 hypothetical protein BST97_14970 [Nonlabens spongiae]